MGWDISVSERIYHKLANELLFKIINGTIPMGSKLSPASTLIREASTSQDTIRKALCVLTKQKVISKHIGAILLPMIGRSFAMPVSSILSRKQCATKLLC